MNDPEELQIRADMDEIMKNIDSIIDKLNNLDPGKPGETAQTEMNGEC